MTDNNSQSNSQHYLSHDLIPFLESEGARSRMLVLHQLCEGYADDPSILRSVMRGWDHWGEDAAFPEFPMLSFLPIAVDQVEECCQRAGLMVEDRKLVEPACRCAGKLIEQVASLPPDVLRDHVEKLQELTHTSKIFFRVDMHRLRRRIDLMQQPADQLAAALNDSIARLSENSEDDGALAESVVALEALRRNYPDYIDLESVLESGPGSGGEVDPSFRATMQSLTQLAAPGLEGPLEQILLSDREFVCGNAIEALVRLGGHPAAEALLHQFEKAPAENQKWIARGLQRMRVTKLAPAIAALRDGTRDPHMWLMLLIAEVKQCDLESTERLAFDLARLRSASQALIDSLQIFIEVHAGQEILSVLRDSITNYLARACQQEST